MAFVEHTPTVTIAEYISEWAAQVRVDLVWSVLDRLEKDIKKDRMACRYQYGSNFKVFLIKMSS